MEMIQQSRDVFSAHTSAHTLCKSGENHSKERKISMNNSTDDTSKTIIAVIKYIGII